MDQSDQSKKFSLPIVAHEKHYVHYTGMQTVEPERDFTKDQPDYAENLAKELSATLQGEVRFDTGSRGQLLHGRLELSAGAHRGSGAQRRTRCHRDGAALPGVRRTLDLSRRRHQSSRTDHQRRGDPRFLKYMDKVLEIDPETETATIQPGCNLDTLRFKAQDEHNLTFGPDPATHSRNTLGGMIGNNSCGIHSVMAQFYGHGPLTVHQVASLDILTYDGERMTVGATSDEELQNIIAAGRAQRADLRRLEEVA